MTTKTQGTVLQVSDGASPEVYSSLAEVVDIGADRSRGEIPTTTLSDTAIRRIAGLVNAGPVNFTLQWDKDETTHQTLRTLFNNGTLRNFQIVDANSPAETNNFSAFVSNLGKQYQLDDVVRCSVTLTVDGLMNES